jgi:hypothetical protein
LNRHSTSPVNKKGPLIGIEPFPGDRLAPFSHRFFGKVIPGLRPPTYS